MCRTYLSSKRQIFIPQSHPVSKNNKLKYYVKFVNCNYGPFEINGNFCKIVFNCVDINECSQGTSGCSQLCTNTIGSYTCACHNGYQLSNDNHTCTDIDECSINNGGCDHNCINTPGSYQCQCREGYETNNNGINCTGMMIQL